jgi:heme/copper-type cytochrome/quinol oxidase subunit 3
VDRYETPLTPESWGKLGMWVFLAGDAMSFGGLLATYGVLRFGALNWPNPTHVLGIWLTAAMTFLLICSSVTMVKALEAIKEGDQARMCRFLGLTIGGGVLFLLGQAYEWTHLMHGGLGLAANTFIVDAAGNVVGNTAHGAAHALAAGQMHASPLIGTTFFMTTGFHGCHVFGGVVYLTCVLIKGLRGGYSSTNWNGVENVGLYWHFVDLIWILVFTFVYLV